MGTLQSQGPVAQLGERRVRNAEVEGSNPFGSTNVQRLHTYPACTYTYP